MKGGCRSVFLRNNSTYHMKKYLGLLLICVSSYTYAQSFSSGYNFNIPFDDASMSPFLPKFKTSPITVNDKVSVSGKHFIVNNQSYRFWGVNMVAASAFPAKTVAPKIAAHAAKMGINLVRFHHLDNPWAGNDGSIFVNGQPTRQLNATTLDRMEFLINELKKNGIYTNMNLNVSRTFNNLDGVLHADSLTDFGKVATIIDPQLITLQKEYASQILTHVNSYTGLALKDDPALAMVEIINENSLYGYWRDDDLETKQQGGNLLVRHVQRLNTLWNAFLTTKYGTQAALIFAWQSGRGVNPELIQEGSFEGAAVNSNWQIEQNNGATASFSQASNTANTGTKSAKVVISNATGTNWHIQFKHTGFDLKKDTTYVLKFAAKAAQNRNIDVSLIRNNSPFTYYGGQRFSLTPNWQMLQFTVTPSESNSGEGRFSFNLGTNAADVWIDDVSLQKPTKIGLISGENLAQNNINRIKYSDRDFYASQRIADQAEFYIKLQQDFMEEMKLFLVNTIGVTAPITGTNALAGIQEAMQHENMDFYDDHAYWDHPQFPGSGFDPNNFLIDNQSLTNSNSYSSITNAFSGIHKSDKPLTISEYNNGFPNIYRAEMIPAMAAYGSFHGMDGVMFFDYNSEADNSWNADFVNGFFSIHKDHSVMGLFPSAAYAYRNGLIQEATPFLVNYSEKDIYFSHEKDNNSRWGKYTPYDKSIQYSQSLQVGSYRDAQGVSAQTLPTPQSGTHITSTNETVLNTTNSFLKTATPKYISITGDFTKNANQTAGDLTLVSGSDHGSITWLSLTNQGLSESDTTLLSVSSRIQNTGMTWNGANTTVTNWGSSPTQLLPLLTTLRVNSDAPAIRLHLLSVTGSPISSKVISPVSSGVFEITVNQAVDKTMWYALQAVEQGATVLAAEATSGEVALFVYPNPTRDSITVGFEIDLPKTVEIGIFDNSGREQLKFWKTYQTAGAKQEILTLNGLSSGAYTIRLNNQAARIVLE
jgi:hypothetical protein